MNVPIKKIPWTSFSVPKVALVFALVLAVFAAIALPTRKLTSPPDESDSCSMEVRGMDDSRTSFSSGHDDIYAPIVIEIFGEESGLGADRFNATVDGISISRSDVEKFEYVTTLYGRQIIVTPFPALTSRETGNLREFNFEYTCLNGKKAVEEKNPNQRIRAQTLKAVSDNNSIGSSRGGGGANGSGDSGNSEELQSASCYVPFTVVVPFVYHTTNDGFEVNNLFLNRYRNFTLRLLGIAPLAS